MKTSKYKHLQEPIRIKIATDYIQHEMRKILPGIKNKSIWNNIDKDINNLTKNEIMTPVRDFWNLVDAICFGLKLKNLVPKFTSQNIKWSKVKIKIDDLYMGSKNDFTCLNKLDTIMPNGREVKEFLYDEKNGDILKFAKDDSLINSKKTFDRDEYLIIVGEIDNKTLVFDGNRRMLKYILEGITEVFAYKAVVIKQPMLFNYWIPTSRIMNLVSHANLYLQNNDKVTAKSLSQAVGHLIKSSEVGKEEFYDRVINNNFFKGHQFILKEVEKIIGNKNNYPK
jgi:hypothetical protein